VVLSPNGRVKPDLVIVNGQPERHLEGAHYEGAYYLEWREGSKRVRLSVGKDAQDAAARRLRKEAELNAVNNGVAVLPENGNSGHRSLAAADHRILGGNEAHEEAQDPRCVFYGPVLPSRILPQAVPARDRA